MHIGPSDSPVAASASAAGDTPESSVHEDARPVEPQGLPTAPMLIGLSCLVGALIFTVGIVPMAIVSTSGARDSVESEQTLIAGGVALRTRNFFDDAKRVPAGTPPALIAPGFDMRNETNILPVLATALRSCRPNCFSVYYGINSDENLHFTLGEAADGTFFTNRRGPPPLFRRQRAPVTGVLEGRPIAGPFVTLNVTYTARDRPWWPILFNSSRWVPVYQDFASDGTATTTGGPVRGSAGEVLAVFAVDVVFTSLFADLRSASATTRRAVLYEAGSHVMLYSSWGQRSDTSIVHLNATTDSRMSQALRQLSAVELDSETVVTERAGSTLIDDAIRVQPVALDTGLNLRFVLVVEAGEDSRRIVAGLVWSVVGGVLATLFVTVLVAVLAILVVERPLTKMANRVNSDCDSALRGEAPTAAETSAEQRPRDVPMLREMRVIQSAFDDVVEELRRVRAFIPDGCFFDASELSHERSFNQPLVLLSPGAHEEADGNEVAVITRPRELENEDDLSSIGTSIPLSSADQSGKVSPANVATPSFGASVSVRQAGRSLTPSSRAWAALRHARPTAKTDHFLTAASVAYVEVSIRSFARVLEDLPDVGHTAVGVCDLIGAIVQTAAATFNGAVAHFVGDRAALSFNALKTNNAYKQSAVECALAVSRMVRLLRVDPATSAVGFEAASAYPMPRPKTQQDRVAPIISAQGRVSPCKEGIAGGVAYGRALVGNIGSAGLTRFCVFSDAVQSAAKKVAICQQYDAVSAGSPLQCIATTNIAPDLAHTVAFQYVDFSSRGGGARAHRSVSPGDAMLENSQLMMQSQRRANNALRHLVLAPMRMLLDLPQSLSTDPSADSNNGDEWMYQLKRAESANEFAVINRGFEAFATGDLTQAKEHLESARASASSGACAVGIAQLALLVARHASV